MSDWPAGSSYYKSTLCSTSWPFSMPRTWHGSTNSASTAWVAANRAIYLPFALVAPKYVTKLFWVNGATITGTVHAEAAIYRAGPNTATLLTSTGSITQAGVSALQASTLATPIMLTPGPFYLVLTHDSTQTFAALAYASRFMQTIGAAQQASVGPGSLPATATFAAVASSFWPVCGMSNAAVL